MNTEKQVMQIPIEDLVPNRFQPRISFDEKALNDLANSIKQHGIIQPLVVRRLGDKYEIIAGERRYKAAQIAGLISVPGIIANVNDQSSAEMALVENVQRKDLSAIEEARSYKNILESGDMTQEELAKKMGLSQSSVANKLRLLNLNEEVQEALLQGKISERHARSLLGVNDENKQIELLHKILDERLTVRQLDDIIKNNGINVKDDVIDDVPLVDLNGNLEEMQRRATDINPQIDKRSFTNIGNEEASTGNKFFQYNDNSSPTVFKSDEVDNLGRPQLMPEKPEFFNFGSIPKYAETDKESYPEVANVPTSTNDTIQNDETKETVTQSPIENQEHQMLNQNNQIINNNISDQVQLEPKNNNDIIYDINALEKIDSSYSENSNNNMIEEMLDVEAPSDGIDSLDYQPGNQIFEQLSDEPFDLMLVVDDIRACVSKHNADRNIRIEEIDNGGKYQINITIEKE